MSPPLRVRNVVVLGAGTMGAQVAAHLAGCGLDVTLLDMVPPDAGADRNELASRAVDNLRRLKPSPLHRPEDAAAELRSVARTDLRGLVRTP